MTVPPVGRLAMLLADLDLLVDLPLSDAERFVLQWIAAVPAFTTADLIAVVHRFRAAAVR